MFKVKSEFGSVMYDVRRKVRDGDAVVVVVEVILVLLLENLVSGAGSGVCPPSCRCTAGSATVVSCYGVGRVPVPLPLSTVILDLDHNHISLLTNASFGRGLPLRRLKELSLQDNGLLHIEAGALVTLTELRVLRLGRNHLSSLPATVFAANRKLTVLDVHANYFAVLPDVALRHLHSLTVLNVSFNHLTSPRLGPEFRYTTQLSYLDLAGQYISCHFLRDNSTISRAGLSQSAALFQLRITVNLPFPPLCFPPFPLPLPAAKRHPSNQLGPLGGAVSSPSGVRV